MGVGRLTAGAGDGWFMALVSSMGMPPASACWPPVVPLFPLLPLPSGRAGWGAWPEAGWTAAAAAGAGGRLRRATWMLLIAALADSAALAELLSVVACRAGRAPAATTASRRSSKKEMFRKVLAAASLSHWLPSRRAWTSSGRAPACRVECRRSQDTGMSKSRESKWVQGARKSRWYGKKQPYLSHTFW